MNALRLIFAAALVAAPAWAQNTTAPLSAIDWLSRSVEAPLIFQPTEPAVTNSASQPDVTVMALDGPSPDSIGLLRPALTGLPVSLWSRSLNDELTDLVHAERVDTLPALQELLITLMLAEADPPLGAGRNGDLFLARVDKLLDIGAIEQAQALIEASDTGHAPLFRRWFDVALLTGTEADACAQMRATPDIAPTYPARIFCLARGGDWMAAALILNTGRALGDITAEEDALLSRFLDPDLFENEPPLPLPTRTSPLVFRMREAIGERLATASLPRAFAHADLRNTSGWRNQIEAAERLARTGVLSPNRLQALYTARVPAASGGVWDRAAAFQKFDRAISARDTVLIANALPAAWTAMQQARLEIAFAELYAGALAQFDLPGEARAIALNIGLLSPEYETTAIEFEPNTDTERFILAVARGDASEMIADSPAERAIALGFSSSATEDTLQMARDGKVGELILRLIARFDSGTAGDTGAITEAISGLRAIGLEDTARKAALQFLLLERS